MGATSVYVHFPWCLSKCPYCDFVSYAASFDAQGYLDLVLRELTVRARGFDDRCCSTVFFGGGTPSLWSPWCFGAVLAAIREYVPTTKDLEVTVEANPTSMDAVRASELRDQGVTRISLGVQSLDAGRLRFLGRLHDPNGARRALDASLASGLRVSADLMFGLAGQTPDQAVAEVVALDDLGLLHLSCYQLTVEAGTPFGQLARRGHLPQADDALVAESFLAIDDALTGRGFAHYEISNYARPGEEARHNLGYWHGHDYLGLGCAAVGCLTEGNPARGGRYRNPLEPDKYAVAVGRLELGEELSDLEQLDATTLLRERIMLGLRLSEGIDLVASALQLGTEPWPAGRAAQVERLLRRGRLERVGARLRIPRDAWLWTDDTAASLF